MPHDPDRFLALVCRELGATVARITEGVEEVMPGTGPLEVRCPIKGGRAVVARFADPPADRDDKLRRLEILAATFDAVAVDPAEERRSRPPVAQSLREELEALCKRAAAVNAMVVDANSPVVWGAAQPEGVVTVPAAASSPSMAGAAAVSAKEPESRVAATSRRALRDVRALPEMTALRKGKHLRYVQRSGQAPLVSHSFAGIYLLVVVLDPAQASFDELRAERAILDALPRVERLVLALPPQDPQPSEGGGVVAMRRPRRA